MIAHLLVSLLATSALQTTRMVRSSAVSMGLSNDLKKGFATLGVVASMSLIPLASEAISMPSSAMALKPNVKPVSLGDEPNKLKLGFRGLGLTTGFRTSKPAAKATTPAKVVKGVSK